MLKRAQQIANLVKKADTVHVVSHIDADGLTSGAIAVQTLKRLGKDHSIEFVKQMDEMVIKRLTKEQHELVWFTDLGSSIVDTDSSFPMIVTDHHVCNSSSNVSFHLNPHLFGYDGSYELSGAGATYFVSKAVDQSNKDLAALAVVGACGDLQNRKMRRLISLNEQIIEDGKKEGVIDARLDIQYFGRETRPIYKLLQYANDPIIPGVTGREKASLGFLKDVGIPLKDGEQWRYWIHLSTDERRKIISSIAKRLLSKGFGHQITKRIIGQVYTLNQEQEGTELHDAKEFATLLNSTARYGQFDVGLSVCLGDRKKALTKARSLLRGHRHNLVEGIQFAKEEGIEQRDYVQFFHAKQGIRDTIVGIVANMLLNDEEVRTDLPLVGFAYKNDSEVKASARATQLLVDKGLDLSEVMNRSAGKVEGAGGGHNIAAGATIPKGKEEQFLQCFEKEVKRQLTS